MLNESDEDGAAGIAGVQQFAVLHQHFPRVTPATKCILLSTYAKMQHLYPELKDKVRDWGHLWYSCLSFPPCLIVISTLFDRYSLSLKR